jgi:hypothetical protein
MDAETILRQAEEAARRQQQGAAPGVMPSPVPTSVQLLTGHDGQGGQMVILVFSTPVGQNVFHFDAESADKIADGIKDAARVARTGLEIPKM